LILTHARSSTRGTTSSRARGTRCALVGPCALGLVAVVKPDGRAVAGQARHPGRSRCPQGPVTVARRTHPPVQPAPGAA